MSAPLHYLTIAEAAPRIEARELSPVALTEAYLARIQAIDGGLNAYVLVTAERARADARRAEAEIAAGHYRGPLHGIPIALKDIINTAGIRTTCHSHLLIDHVPSEDADCVRRLSEAGAVLLGKLATHEFAFGGPSFDLPFPLPRNPWNTEHFAGGSSSGSGVAVAAGLCMGALGTDTGGSIRLPAAYCGIAGLKATYGRVSRRGVAPLAFTLDHVGPMTWTARDAALMLQALAGHDPADPGSADMPVGDYAAHLTGDIRGLRIGLVRHFHQEDEQASPALVAAFDNAAATFRSLGASVGDVRLSSLRDYHACCFVILLAEGFSVHEADLKTRPDKFGEAARDRLMLSSFLSAPDYVQAMRMRRQLAAEMRAALGQVDVLVTAGALDAAPRIADVSKFSVITRPIVTAPFNVTGSPTIAVCVGHTAAGLPLGMQIAGRAFDEATVLRVADAYERATPWRARRPLP